MAASRRAGKSPADRKAERRGATGERQRRQTKRKATNSLVYSAYSSHQASVWNSVRLKRNDDSRPSIRAAVADRVADSFRGGYSDSGQSIFIPPRPYACRAGASVHVVSQPVRAAACVHDCWMSSMLRPEAVAAVPRCCMIATAIATLHHAPP